MAQIMKFIWQQNSKHFSMSRKNLVNYTKCRIENLFTVFCQDIIEIVTVFVFDE